MLRARTSHHEPSQIPPCFKRQLTISLIKIKMISLHYIITCDLTNHLGSYIYHTSSLHDAFSVMKMQNNLEEINTYSTSWQQIQRYSPGACHGRAKSAWWWGSGGVSVGAALPALPSSDPHLHYPLLHKEYPIVCWETSLYTIKCRPRLWTTVK